MTDGRPSPAVRLAVQVLVVVVPVAVLVAAHWWVADRWLDARRLERDGSPAVATVVGRDANRAPRQGDRFEVTIRYRVPGGDGAEREQVVSTVVDRATFDAVVEGSTVAVRYDPDDPDRVVIIRSDAIADDVFVLVVVDVVVAGAFIALVRWARRQPPA